MNKKTNSNNTLILFISAIAASVISVALRCINLFCFFDSEIGYYASGAILPTVSNVLLLIFALFFIVFPFITMKKSAANCREASGVYWKVAVGILSLVLLTVVLAFSYFNQKVQMNAPDKVLFGLACITSMVFVANELRVAVGTKRDSTHSAFAALTLLIGATASVPSLIAYYTGALTSSDGMHLEYYLILAMAIYAAVRLLGEKQDDNVEASSEPIDFVTDTPSEGESESTDSDATE